MHNVNISIRVPISGIHICLGDTDLSRGYKISSIEISSFKGTGKGVALQVTHHKRKGNNFFNGN